jgi:DNA-binding response OmpR family regulator
MIVDADVLSRMAIEDYLRHCGYPVIEGGSAEDVAAVLATEREVDVMLIEMTLSGTEDGFSLARKVRSEQPDSVVILTSSAAEQAEKAGELCGDGPLMKPYDPSELERRLTFNVTTSNIPCATRMHSIVAMLPRCCTISLAVPQISSGSKDAWR